MNQPIMQSKLHIPPLRPNTLTRKRLLEKLNHGKQFNHKLILVCAPAGSGKSTLLCDWIAQTKTICAWVALDRDDNDPARFIRYLITALTRATEKMGHCLFPENYVPEPDTIWQELINALQHINDPLIILLDDYHLIESEAIHNGIVFLTEHLPPIIQLVLVTRSDPPLPIARLRVHQQITEIRERDISFTISEAQDFINTATQLTISQENIEALHKRTEGWIAGLQLAALSLQGHDDKADFIAQFTGSNRFILDYLTEEVLHQQKPEIQNFLLKTSIIEQLNADLCQAITGIENCKKILDTLYRDNLFLIPLDSSGNTYRYHHLFADLLRLHLQQNHADYLPALHLAAAEWYITHGHVVYALRHYLSGNHHKQAADLVESEAFTLYNQGNLPALINLIQQLPPHLAQQRPWLNAYNGFFLTLSGQVEQGEKYLTLAEKEKEDRPLIGFIAAIRAHVYFAHLQLTKAREQAQIALNNIPLDYPFINSYSLYGMGKVLMSLGELEQANQVLLQALQLGEANGHIINIIPLLSYLAQIALLNNNPNLADTYLLKAEYYTNQNRAQTSRLAAFWQMVKASLYYEKKQYDQALSIAEYAIENSLKFHNIFTGVQSYLIQSQILSAMNQPKTAAAALKNAKDLLQRYPIFLDLQAMALLQEANLALKTGDLNTAQKALDNCQPGESVLLQNQKNKLTSQIDNNQPKDDKFPYHPELIEQLSAREFEVLQLIAGGLSNQAIADQLVVTLSTVKKHCGNIYDKLGIRTRTQAIQRAQELGLIE